MNRTSDLTNDIKDQQMKVLQETIRNLQTQLLDNSMKERENLSKISDLEKQLKQASVKELLLKTKILKATKNEVKQESGAEDSDEDVVCLEDEAAIKLSEEEIATATEPIEPKDEGKTGEKLSVDEAHLIGLMSTYLVVHPFGATVRTIHEYLQRVLKNVDVNEMNNVLNRHKTIFGEVDGSDELMWKFIGFDSNQQNNVDENVQSN